MVSLYWKRGINIKEKIETNRGFSDQDRDISHDERFRFVKYLVEQLEKDYSLKEEEILSLFTKRILIPVYIFNKHLSSLEAIVKYLKEELDLSFVKIAELLNRDSRTIWTSYDKARKKYPHKFVAEDMNYFIPLDIFRNREIAVLENIVVYLKENYNLNFKNIGLVLHRNEKTVWTVYNRAMKKRGGQWNQIK